MGTELKRIVLRLYVSGMNPQVERSVANLRRRLDREPDWEYDLGVYDVLEHPQVAENNKILVTPTLVLVSPPPARKVIGDLSDTRKVLFHLGLPFRDTTEQEGPHPEAGRMDGGETSG